MPTGVWGQRALVMEPLSWPIIEHKVTGQEAFGALPHGRAPVRDGLLDGSVAAIGLAAAPASCLTDLRAMLWL